MKPSGRRRRSNPSARAGSLLYDPVLYRAKDPAASKGPWDLYEVLRTIPQGEGSRNAA
jgi:hypothetical protein